MLKASICTKYAAFVTGRNTQQHFIRGCSALRPIVYSLFTDFDKKGKPFVCSQLKNGVPFVHPLAVSF